MYNANQYQIGDSDDDYSSQSVVSPNLGWYHNEAPPSADPNATQYSGERTMFRTRPTSAYVDERVPETPKDDSSLFDLQHSHGIDSDDSYSMPGSTTAPPLPNDDEDLWAPVLKHQATRIDNMDATILVYKGNWQHWGPGELCQKLALRREK